MKKGYKMTEVGVIPEDWSIYPFAELGNLAKSKISPQRDRKIYKCIELEHIEQGTGQLIGSVDSIHQLSDKWLFSEGDVLFGKLRPYLRKFYLADFTGVCTTEIWVLKPTSKTISPYLYLVIQSDRFIESANLSTGTKMPRAEWKTVSQTQIPLPPTVTEQRAIATALSDVDRLLSAYDQLIAKKKAIKQGAMQELLTGRRRLEGFEGEWVKEELGKFVLITSGESPSKFEMLDFGIPYFKIEQLNNSNKYQKETPYFIHQPLPVKSGSLIFPKRGASIFLNKIRILYQSSYMDTNLMALTTTSELDNEFLFYYLTYKGLSQIADTTSIPQINNKHIIPFEIKIPTINEQRAIAQILTDMDAEIAALEQQREKYKAVKAGMMQELLTGKIRLI